MRLRFIAALAASAAVLGVAAPASAHEMHHQGGYMPAPGGYPGAQQAPADYDPRERDAWLAECHDRIGSGGGVGAVIGGLVGGVAGNRIAGRDDRLLGTVVGAVGGAVAGAVIDRSISRSRSRDRCEAMLDDYAVNYRPDYYGRGYAPGYAPGYAVAYAPVMVPAMVQHVQQAPICTETTVTTEQWVDVPGAHRYIPPRPHYRPQYHQRVPHYAPDKRVRLAPDKRVLMGS